jgi:hypothetical protein
VACPSSVFGHDAGARTVAGDADGAAPARASGDIEGLVEGVLQQERLLSLAPRPVGAEDLDAIFRESLTNW